MAATSNLSNSVLNLSAIRETSRRELVSILESIRGPKVLLIDPQLVGPLGLIAEGKLLKEKGVEQIYKLSEDPFDHPCKNILYIVRPRMNMMKMIAAHVHYFNDHATENSLKDFHVYCVPRKTLICERVLEEAGVYGDIILREYALDLIPFDDDLLSIEMPSSFKECNLDGDMSSLYYVARSLMKIQSLYGVIRNVKVKGKSAKIVYDMIARMRQQAGNEDLNVVPEIDTLILIDRKVDLVTPLVTQLTYEGLIDELFGIQNGLLEPNLDSIPPTKDGKKRKIPLNSNDKIFSEIRDLNFSAVGNQLNKKAVYLDENYKQRHQVQTVSDIRDFMRKLPDLQQEHQSLGIHINIAQEINQRTLASDFRKRIEIEQYILLGLDEKENMDYIEECIDKQEPLTKVLRLLCLFSQTNNGIKAKVYDYFRREILQSYGYEAMLTLDNLETAGLLRRQEGRTNWHSIKKGFNLLVEDIDESNPTDLSYVYAGYAPLTARLVEATSKPGGWRALDEYMRQLSGPTIEEVQQGSMPTQNGRKITLVFFIGGVTFAEISAIRFLNNSEEGREYVIATTKLINGDTFIESLFENVGRIKARS